MDDSIYAPKHKAYDNQKLKNTSFLEVVKS